MEASAWQFEKVVGDPIHSYIRLDDLCWDVIDTEEFQRLRDLKQLGSAYFVFPGASHNRFEHSIGVSYLAGKTVERFRTRQPELELTEEDARCVRIAGLCHDIGHGPFSHVFDNEFIPRARPGVTWSHEAGSEMMLEYLVEENHIDLEASEVRFIKALIAGTPSHSEERDGKRFLFDIVANKRNGIDVDKLDYLARDCYHLGEQAGYDGKRLLEFSEVRENQVCYYHKEVYNIYELFNTRYSLFKRIYCHRVGKAIEYMITDALLAADSVLGISESIGDPGRYKQLTDAVLRHIEFSKDEQLATSREIIRRIRQRNLYRFVCEYLIPPHWMGHLTKEKINEKTLIDHQPSGAHLAEGDAIVEWAKLNYGSGDRNPVDSVKFYSKHDRHEAFNISKERVSLLVPERYQEVIIRVYARDTKKVRDILKAFQSLMSTFTSSLPGGISEEGEGSLGLDRMMRWRSPKKRRYASFQEEKEGEEGMLERPRYHNPPSKGFKGRIVGGMYDEDSGNPFTTPDTPDSLETTPSTSLISSPIVKEWSKGAGQQ